MTLLRVPATDLAEGERVLPREAASYVVNVHRLAPGARFLLFDPEARVECEATLERTGRDVVARLDPPRPATNVPSFATAVVQCVGKADKLDQVVRDATELGMTELLPAISARSVARKTSEGAVQRLRRIAVEAARQCGRGDLPRVAPPRPLPDVLDELAAEVRIALDPAAKTPVAELLAKPAASYAFLIGPEGGLAPEELQLAAARGFRAARLGRFTLRTETAAAAILGALAAFADRPRDEAL
jgi:16S rRNA (uracil1498-N3)-methyltransferase